MADETVLQTVKRNLTPETDTSKAALGPGGQLTSGPSPQAEGEQQYKDALGSPQEQAYGKLKNWLSEHEQHFSDKVLKPFRAGLDNMAEDLQTAGESGRTKSGGELTPTTRALALGAGEALKAVPIGKDVKETAAGIALDFSHLKGHTLIEEAPKAVEEAEQLAYRARPVGQKGIAAGERPVATSSLEKARAYKENLESMTGQPHEVVQTSVKSGEHNKHAGPDKGETWFSFKKEIPEESVKVHESRSQSEQPKERLPKVKDLRVPAERDTPGHNETIKQGGAIPGGIQKGDPEINLPDLALFHDPATGSTLALPVNKMSAKAVKEQIQKSRQMYLGAEDRAAVSTKAKLTRMGPNDASTTKSIFENENALVKSGRIKQEDIPGIRRVFNENSARWKAGEDYNRFLNKVVSIEGDPIKAAQSLVRQSKPAIPESATKGLSQP